jgi:ABC-type branched-subunit amino acid transport system substrate-binding protein
MKIKSRWLVVFLVMGLVLAACSPSDGDSTDTTEAETAATTTEASTDTTEATTDTTEGEMEILTDVGVDLDAGTITVGLLSDLTGVFSALVQPVVDGYQTKVDDINANGGIHGLEIKLEVRDTVYSVDTHVQLYEELRDSVVMLGHSTGSPHSVAIAGALAEDNMLAVPLTWYSGWSDPALNANLIPHGAPYCIEAMNSIGYLLSLNPDAATIAIASNAGDFGEDSAEGAKLAAEAAGLEVVYDGQAKVNAADEASLAEVATGIIGSDPDIVWVTTSPGAYAGIYGQALAAGVAALWSGSFVAWNSGLIAEGSAIRDAAQRDWTFSLPIGVWGADNQGTKDAVALLTAAIPDIVPYEYYLEGVGEAILLETILNAAYESGDLTRAGVLAAAKSLESMSWDGLWPDQQYTGTPNDTVQRLATVVRPSAADLDAGGSGLEVLESDYTSDLAAAFEFNETCFAAFG